MTFRRFWILTKAAAASWMDDYAQSMGAALAYYTMFSIAPLLLIVISVAGLIFGADAARGEIVAQLRGLMGPQGAIAVQSLLEGASRPADSIPAMVLGAVLLLVGATSVFAELQDALDRIWRAPKRLKTGVWTLLRARLLSFGLIMGIGFLLMVSLVVSAALAALGRRWGMFFSDWRLLAVLINFILSFLITTTFFALIYKLMPRVDVDWADVWIGAVVTSLLFTVGKSLISLYIGRSGVTSGFGAAGSLVVLLVWVYYSAQVFLMGAEFTWAYSITFGSRKALPIPLAAPAVPSEAPTGSPEPHLALAKRGAAKASQSHRGTKT